MGFSNQNVDISSNGYVPNAFVGIGRDYANNFINSVTNKLHNVTKGVATTIKCIFFNKNGITTLIQIAPNGAVLVSSMTENYNKGDSIRFYANFYSTQGGTGISAGTYYKINFVNTYQSF